MAASWSSACEILTLSRGPRHLVTHSFSTHGTVATSAGERPKRPSVCAESMADAPRGSKTLYCRCSGRLTVTPWLSAELMHSTGRMWRSGPPSASRRSMCGRCAHLSSAAQARSMYPRASAMISCLRRLSTEPHKGMKRGQPPFLFASITRPCFLRSLSTVLCRFQQVCE